MSCTLIIITIHKVAEAIARVLGASTITPQQTRSEELQQYDLVGFGSGIYAYQHNKSLLELVNKLPQVSDKKAIIFSTTGTPIVFGESTLMKAIKYHKPLKNKLEAKGYTIVDEFICAGFNTNKFLKYFGGINKGRPNKEDLKHAQEFAIKLERKLE